MFRASLIIYVASSDGERAFKVAESGYCWNDSNSAMLFHSDTRGIAEFDRFVSNHRMVRLCFVACVGVFHSSIRLRLLTIPFFPQRPVNDCRAYEL